MITISIGADECQHHLHRICMKMHVRKHVVHILCIVYVCIVLCGVVYMENNQETVQTTWICHKICCTSDIGARKICTYVHVYIDRYYTS